MGSSFFLNMPIIINVIIVGFTLPFILSSIPIQEYGKYQFILALQAWLSHLTGNNITSASKRGISKGLNGTLFYALRIRFRFLLISIIIVVGIMLYCLLSRMYILMILLAISHLYLLSGYLFQVGLCEYLVAKKRFKEWSFWQIVVSIISIVGATWIALSTKNVICYATFQLGSASFISLIALYILAKKEDLFRSYKRNEIDKSCVLYGLKLIPVDLIGITAVKISHFIIGSVFGFTNLAVFSVAMKMRDKCAGVIKSVRSLLYADFAKKKRSALKKMYHSHLLKITILGVILTCVFIIVAKFYITSYLPLDFTTTFQYFIILSFGFPAVMLSIVLHTLLESHLRYKELVVVGIIPNVTKILLILSVGYVWKIKGICFAWTISNWCIFIFYYYLTINTNFVRKMISKYKLLQKLSNF